MPIYRQVPRPPPRGVNSSNGHYQRMSVLVVAYPGLSLRLHVSETPNSPRKTLGDLATLALHGDESGATLGISGSPPKWRRGSQEGRVALKASENAFVAPIAGSPGAYARRNSPPARHR